MRRLLILLLGFLPILPGIAEAHSGASLAVPGPGDTARAGMTRIDLDFAGEVGSSDIDVRNDAGAEMISDSPTISGNHVTAHLDPLQPGLYTVQYTAVLSDGHPANGGYYLQVAPAPPGVRSSAWTPWIYAGSGGLIVVLLIVIGLLLAYRPRED